MKHAILQLLGLSDSNTWSSACDYLLKQIYILFFESLPLMLAALAGGIIFAIIQELRPGPRIKRIGVGCYNITFR